MMIVLALTGSIGMGKSTAGVMFADRGIPMISADEIVHSLYSGRAAPKIEAAFPGTVVDATVDREKLSAAVLKDEVAFKRLEAIVHPLVEEERRSFVDEHRRAGQPLVVLDIPLLYEGGGKRHADRVLVVSCDSELQRERVLKRPGMTVEKFESILARQVSDAEKRARADYVVDTSGTFEETQTQIDAIADRILADGDSGK